MTAAKRQDAGAAVGGLFDRPSATGGLAGAARSTETPRRGPALAGRSAPASSPNGVNVPVAGESRVRLGVELTERETEFLRSLSRPVRTGGPRTLGSKFVGTGILAAAIELLADGGIDMYGVAAGDLDEMTARARAALLRAAHEVDETKEAADDEAD
jgi:hypothetical protein